jgi:hypothetical protein
MRDSSGPTVLQPRLFLDTPWVGTGEWIPRRSLKRGPEIRRFEFRAISSRLTDDLWIMHHTAAWADGPVQRRGGIARLVAPGHVDVTYDGMPGGTEIVFSEDGLTISPYRLFIAAPLLPVALVVRARHRCHWEPDARELHSTIELAVSGVVVGRHVVALKPELAAPLARPNF